MQEHSWNHAWAQCSLLLAQALDRISKLTGLLTAYSGTQSGHPHSLPPQMGVARLPRIHDLTDLKTRLFDEYWVEVPLIDWEGEQLIRISVQGYNTGQDIEALIQALTWLLPEMRR